MYIYRERDIHIYIYTHIYTNIHIHSYVFVLYYTTLYGLCIYIYIYICICFNYVYISAGRELENVFLSGGFIALAFRYFQVSRVFVRVFSVFVKAFRFSVYFLSGGSIALATPRLVSLLCSRLGGPSLCKPE